MSDLEVTHAGAGEGTGVPVPDSLPIGWPPNAGIQNAYQGGHGLNSVPAGIPEPPRRFPLHPSKQAFVDQVTKELNAYFGISGMVANLLRRTSWELKASSSGQSFTHGIELGNYVLYVKGVAAAHFTLASFPGCCGICISTEANVYGAHRRKGLGTLLNKIRIDWARALGYGILMCTDISKNEYQRKILAKNGWTDIHDFVNPRTSNQVIVSVINL